MKNDLPIVNMKVVENMREETRARVKDFYRILLLE